MKYRLRNWRRILDRIALPVSHAFQYVADSIIYIFNRPDSQDMSRFGNQDIMQVYEVVYDQ